MKSLGILGAVVALSSTVIIGCTERAEIWDEPADVSSAHGLSASVAVVDRPADRLLSLSVGAELELGSASLPLREGFIRAATSADGQRLITLSQGAQARRSAKDPGPALGVYTTGVDPKLERTYELGDPLSGLALDEASSLAVLYPSGDSAFVENPNELAIVDLAAAPSPTNPTTRTLRSFGGLPETFTFTPELELPGGKTRLLAVGTDRDVALLDLTRLDQPEITIRLTGSSSVIRPAGFAVTDGEPGVDTDARVAVRVASETSVYIIDLEPQPDGSAAPQPYRAVPNVVYVGGAVTDLAFVRTDAGPRLAALVPSRSKLVLIDPVTAVTSEVSLGVALTHISLVTDVVGQGADGSDVALLWSESASALAFVALGSTIGTPYKAVELVSLPAAIEKVSDVPAPNERLKILRLSGGRSFIVLDLKTRTASPLVASTSGTRVQVAPDGQHAWLYSPGSDQLANVDLTTLHPQNLFLSRPIANLFEVAKAGGGRALVALHSGGAGGLTLVDADAPSLSTAREYSGLLLGGL